MKALDFNTVKKNYWKIVLPDEDKTRLDIMTPTKRMTEEMGEILSLLYKAANDPNDTEMVIAYEFVAKCMSRNKQGVTVTGKQLEPILDFEDLAIFLDNYTEFIDEQKQANEKN